MTLTSQFNKRTLTPKMTIKYKTYAQQELEHLHGLPLEDIILETVRRLAGQPHFMAQIELCLGVSGPTVRQWCRDLDIDLVAYKAGDDVAST